MKTLFACAMAAVLGGAAYGQNYGENYRQDFQDQDRFRSESGSTSSQRQVRPFNKASKLIGADVRTRDAQKVGEVKDVVIDFESGRVAYIVVDANDVIEGESSHIAVPARAFRTTRDQDHVTLETDRNRLRNLRSFSENNYPAFRNQSQWSSRSGSQFDQGQQSDRWSQNQFRQDRRQSGQQGSDDPNVYLYEWYVYDIEPAYESQDRYSSGTQRRQDPYGGYGTSQYGTDRYSSERQFQQQGRYDSDRYGNQRWSDEQDEWRSSRNQDNYSRQQQQQQQQRQYRQESDFDSESRYQGGSSRWEPGQGGYGHQQGQIDRQSSQYSYDTGYRDQGSGSQATSSNSSSDSEGQDSRNFSGRIREIDHENRSLTVEGNNRTMTFKLAENPIVKMSGQENASFSQLSEGENVQIGYRYEDGSNKAFSINQTNR